MMYYRADGQGVINFGTFYKLPRLVFLRLAISCITQASWELSIYGNTLTGRLQ